MYRPKRNTGYSIPAFNKLLDDLSNYWKEIKFPCKFVDENQISSKEVKKQIEAKSQDRESGKRNFTCVATAIISEQEHYHGKYTWLKDHAEIEALKKALHGDICKNRNWIQRIEILIPPCKHCALILHELGLSGKVFIPKDSEGANPSSSPGAYPWDTLNEDSKKELFSIITANYFNTNRITKDKLSEGQKEKIVSEFKIGNW